MKIADLLGDMVMLKATQDAAKEVFGKDPLLSKPEHQGLRDRVNRLFEINNSYIFN